MRRAVAVVRFPGVLRRPSHFACARFLSEAAAASTTAQPTSPDSGAVGSPSASPADDGSAKSQSSSPSPPHGPQPPFKYGSRLLYTPQIGNFYQLAQFFVADSAQVRTMFKTYVHRTSGVRVTLIPILHEAHPMFYKQVDELCCQHDSVLMEGRTPLTGAPHSTLVPPRSAIGQVRPDGHEDDEGWEPNTYEGFWQPFSWGVKNSPQFTVVHAADRYDYEKLPWWAGVRFNVPVFGSLARERYCLDMIPPLVENGYRSFAIPWGAYHMPVFGSMLVRNGFEEIANGTLIVFDAIDGVHSAGWVRKLNFKNQTAAMAQAIVLLFLAFFGSFILVFMSFVNVDDPFGSRRNAVFKS